MRAADLNRLLLQGRRRAEELEARLAGVLVPILERAGEEAAQRFRARATDHLTAAARRADLACISTLDREERLTLLASLALTATPGVTGTSTMVALYPRPEEAERLAELGGEEAANLHVTLAFLGDTEESDIEGILSALRPVAATHGPLAGTVGGIGSFAHGPDGRPAILLPDVPGLAELRHATVCALHQSGIDYARNHGFTAHVTVGYHPDSETMPPMEAIGAELHFDHLVLARGNVRHDPLPLVGPRAVTAAGDPPQWSAPVPDELIDVPSLVVRLRAKTKPVRDAVAETMMTPALNRVGIDFDVKNPLVGEVLSQSASQVTHIAETTQLNVMRIIKESYEAGLSIPNTATAIQEGMHASAEERAALIARTELAGVVNGGALAVTKLVSSATGDSFTKKWLTGAGARNPRHELYDDLDGQEQPLTGYFDVGGVQLQHPGDPSGPPEEICNCRCAMSFADGEIVEAEES